MIFCAFVTDIKVDACCVVGDNASRNKITVEANVLESKNINSGTACACVVNLRRPTTTSIQKLITGSAIKERQLKPVELNQTYIQSSSIHPVAQ